MNDVGIEPARIVVGIDGKESGWRALDWAVTEAQAYGLPVLAVHCRKTAPEAGMHPSPVPESISPDLALNEAEQRVHAQTPSVHMTSRTLVGVPSATLHDTTAPSDLLVLGVRRRARLTARILGSTTSRSLTHPPCTVAVIPPPGDDTAEGPFPGHVVAAIKDANSAHRVLPWACAEAHAHQRPLAAVHAEEETPQPAGAVVNDRMLEASPNPLPESLGMLEDSITPWHKQYPDLTTHRAYFYGHPGAVLDYACRQAFALVLSASGRQWRALHLADAALARATCPVIVTTTCTTV